MNQLRNTSFPEPAQSPGLMMWRATNAWQREVRAALAPHDLTHVQFVLLAVVVSSDDSAEGLTQREVAERAGTDAMMTSQVLRALEAKDLLHRTPHPTDKRARTITPTAQGIELANQAVVSVEIADRSFFGPLGDDQDDFVEALGRISR